MTEWNTQRARELYNLAHWGDGFFDVNEQGHLAVYPRGRSDGRAVDLFALSSEMRGAGLQFPVLVRFPDILHQRVRDLHVAFASAMASDGYQGGFTPVYPVKVNQQRSVVEELISPADGTVGLEAGSKPELMAVMALSSPDGGVVVCNGYKDREYVRLALIGQQLGHQVFIVVEKLSELELVISEARSLGVTPLLGLRVRLASIGAGKWQNTGGEKSKFGLSATEILRVVERLREAGMLEALAMLHFHLGSQLANIRDIQKGVRECARYYAELRHLGADIRFVDVGGGLGVDYEGTHSRSFCSINYSVAEYANNVVHSLWEICEQQGLQHPHIITESGRAMTAHHAALLTNVIEVEKVSPLEPLEPPAADDPLIIRDLWQGFQNLEPRSVVESYHEAVHWLAEAQVMFTHGVLDLEQRARAERIYFAICMRIRELLNSRYRAQREIYDELNERLADKYFCNFSLFQSLPDAWAIEQIFPIVPLHRLDTRPDRRGRLVDITCDSDGRIDHYVDVQGVESSLPLHMPEPEQPYLLGIFMVGAYQEILGDMHNLFGDTDSVNVHIDEAGGYRLGETERGDTVEDVLRYVHFDARELLGIYRERIGKLALDAETRTRYLDELEAGLTGYTYLED